MAGSEPADIASGPVSRGSGHTADSLQPLLERLARPPDAPTLPSGTMLGRYRIVSLLGKGGMGEVYCAHDARLDRDVAVKVVRAGARADPQAQKRFETEAVVVGRLNHPNVMAVFDAGEHDGCPYLVSELLEGETLARRLRKGPLAPRSAVEAAIAVARALVAAHACGVVHRDLKPANIFMIADGRIKVIDFGIAKWIRPGLTDESNAGEDVAGTLAYMSPEQAHGEPADARSDLFSIGAVLYEMLYGGRSFRRGSALAEQDATSRIDSQLYPPDASIPGELRTLVQRCLEQRVEDRFQSTQELIAALEHVRQDVSFGRYAHRARKRAAIALIPVAAAAALVWLVTGRPSSVRSPGTDAGRRLTANLEAYDLYLRARIHARQENEADADTAIALLEKAVTLDPQFAAAYAELSHVYALRANQLTSGDPIAIERAELAAEKALHLDPDLAESHHAAAHLLWGTTQDRFLVERAVREYKRALALNPNLDDVHQHLGTLYLHVGLLDQAVAEFQKALELQPGDHNAVRRIGITLIYRGQYEEGLRTFRQAPPQSNASLWHYQVAWALLYLGRDQEARTLMDDYLRAHPDDRGGVVSSTRAIWFAKVGDARSAEADILAAQAKGKGFIHFHHSAYNIASAYALLGRAERAVHWLRIAAETGWPCYPYFANDPNLEKLHGDDAYEKLMQQLKAQWQTYQLTL